MKNTEHDGGPAERMLQLLAVPGQDRARCLDLMETHEDSPDAAGRRRLSAELRERLGRFPERPPASDVDEMTAMAAMLACTPELLDYFAQLKIAPAVVEATMADFGLQLAINRRVHGRFGMDTWKWLTITYSGAMFRLGRLQFLLHRTPAALKDVTAKDWVLDIHIPEAGPLDPGAVARSLSLAPHFFATHFPDRPVDIATCGSWMLDPYLGARLAPTSNIRRFAERFTQFAEPDDAPQDAVYFTFRQRGLANLDRLPRSTSLQRVVLERIDDGGSWQLGHGWVRLDPAVGSTGADSASALRR